MPSSTEHNAYLAFDLGAESGRALLGRLHAGHLTIDEIRRFPNEPVHYGTSLHWDVARLWWEMRKGLAAAENIRLESIGVDTWAVDYALLGEDGELLQNPFHYRDERNSGIMNQVFEIVPADEIYALTGIQFMQINTLCQLFAAQQKNPRLLAAAQRLVTIPDLFHYWMTGNAVCEFTNATTTQMVNAHTRQWATALLGRLGLPASLPAPIVQPGTLIGHLRSGISGPSLAGTPVIAPASHDTGSAVASIAARDGTAFISSGTWSLVGTELDQPILTPQARQRNFTNEGGVCGTTRFLKNVMGLWMLQSCRRCWAADGQNLDYVALLQAATNEPAFRHLVDPDDPSFLKPDDMRRAIDQFCRKTDQPTPATPGAYARAILESLALKYRCVLRDMEAVTGEPIQQIRIIGGGSQNQLLNQFTADATGKRVLAGPVEATALGNIGIQMLATGATSSLAETREIIARSFPITSFDPVNSSQWDKHIDRFEHYCELTYA